MLQQLTINVTGNLFFKLPDPNNIGTAVPATLEAFAASAPTEAIHHEGPIKILADGTHLPANSERTDHVALLFADGWMIHPVTLSNDGDSFGNQAASIKACQALRVLGYDDWQLAPRHVWERHVLDLDRHDPAVDPNLYPGIKSGWHHTSTDCAWTKDKKTGVASSAWFVGSGNGNVSSGLRDFDGFGLAARRVGQ